jgi:hypothetical protein
VKTKKFVVVDSETPFKMIVDSSGKIHLVMLKKFSSKLARVLLECGINPYIFPSQEREDEAKMNDILSFLSET